MRIEIKKSKSNQFYFNIVARNHEIIATSEMYIRKESALKTANLIANESYSGIIDYTINSEGYQTDFKEDDIIVLPKSRYEKLVKVNIFLGSLEANGVYNWVRYGDAHDDFEESTGADYWSFDIDEYLKEK